MNIAQTARTIRLKIIAWWYYDEDARLGALVAGSCETLPSVSERSITAHHLVAMAARASDSKKKLTGVF